MALFPSLNATAFLGRIVGSAKRQFLQQAGLQQARPCALNRAASTAVRRLPIASEAAHKFPVVVYSGREDSSVEQNEILQPDKKRPPPVMVQRSCIQLHQETWQNAAVLIDKPRGWTSFDVCGKLRGLIKMRKVGHAGTLDPSATGLLIVCTGKGTKHVDAFMAQNKEYTGIMRLGEGTASYDADSEVSERLPWEHVTDADITTVQQAFVGELLQLPPMFSAIKVKGERLYKAARRGEEVERPPRLITINELELTRNASCPQELFFRVSCSKGTYVRSLVYDLGKAMKTVAHMTSLRRTKIGGHTVEDAWSIPDLALAVQACRAQESSKASSELAMH